jgi:protein-L-isoaspartate(D-aspartate) O-methyltransferase
MIDNQNLIDHLIKIGVLKTPEIINAFHKIDRAFFVLKEFHDYAYEDYPLSIGYGATISQPYTVAFMLELLRPKKGEKILDIGSGSGWTTALLAYLVGARGKIFGVEIVPKLVEFAKDNLKKFKFSNIKVLKAEGELGLLKEAPYNKILVSAAAQELSQEFIEQLASPGKLVVPIGRSIWKIEKDKKNKIAKEEFPGFAFVPLKYTV